MGHGAFFPCLYLIKLSFEMLAGLTARLFVFMLYWLAWIGSIPEVREVPHFRREGWQRRDWAPEAPDPPQL